MMKPVRLCNYFSSPTNKTKTSEMTTITVKVNGETRSCIEGMLLPEFLTQIGLNLRLIAVEYNGEILHRQYWDSTQMQAGDRLEIVTIVGGGSFSVKHEASCVLRTSD